MAFTLAARIGVVAVNCLGCQFSHLTMFDSSGVGSKKSSLILSITNSNYGMVNIA